MLKQIAHSDTSPLVDDIRIIRVPDALVAEMWSRLAPFLAKGCAALPNVTLEDLAKGIEDGTDDLWTVFDNHRPAAAFVTAQFAGPPDFLGVYALGGNGMRRWVRQMDQVLECEARRRGIRSVRFAGRKAWGRIIPNVRNVGTLGDHAIFERVLA